MTIYSLRLNDPNFVSNIQSTMVRSQLNKCLLLSVSLIRMLTSATSVLEPLHSMFSLVLAGLEIRSELCCIGFFCFPRGWLGGDGGTWQWHSGQACYSWERSSKDIWAASWATVFLANGRWRLDHLSFVAVDTFQHCFLGLQGLGLGFGRGGGFLLQVRRCLCEELASAISDEKPCRSGCFPHRGYVFWCRFLWVYPLWCLLRFLNL